MVQFDKEASQTRDYCVAKSATHARLAQIPRCAKRTLARDDNSNCNTTGCGVSGETISVYDSLLGVLMTELQVVSAEVELLRRVYAAFNRREIDAVLAVMYDDVDWPNGMEGGRVRGKAAVRDYWTRQFEVLDPRVEPRGFSVEADGRIAVEVHQVVHDKSGKLMVDQVVGHVYEIRGGLIRSMEIR